MEKKGCSGAAALSVVAILLATSGQAHSDDWFNPRLLLDNGLQVADLSRFEKGQEVPPGRYHVDIWMNDAYITTRDVTFAPDETGEGLHPCFSGSQLAELGVQVLGISKIQGMPETACIPLEAAIEGALARFDVGQQRLSLTVPQSKMKNTVRGYIPPELWDNGITAGILNYSFTGSHSMGTGDRYEGADHYYLSLRTGLNLGPWRLRDESTWTHSGAGYEKGGTRWQHANTWVERSIATWRARLLVGDAFTPSDVFDGVNFRGVEVMSDEAMLPDSQRGFAPVIRGIARGTALVTVRQNGYDVYQVTVPPGPFVLRDLGSTGSSADLRVIVHEADGTDESFAVPYTSVPALQREGYIKYAVNAGQFRSGLASQAAPGFIQGTALWGLREGWTVYGGAQLANEYRAFSVGGAKNMGDYGAVSADLTRASATLPDRTSHEGQSVRMMYAKSLDALGTNVQLSASGYSRSGFYSLSDTAYRDMRGYTFAPQEGPPPETPIYIDYRDLSFSRRQRIQVSVTQPIADVATFYASGSSQTYWNTARSDRQVQVGFSSAAYGVTYNVSYNLNDSAWRSRRERTLFASLSVAMDGASNSDSLSLLRRSNLTYSVASDTQSGVTQLAGMSGTLLRGNNLTYSVQQGHASGSEGGYMGNAGLSYRAPWGEPNAGYSRSGNTSQLYFGMSGGAIVHADGVTLSQPLSDTEVLVKAPGAGNVLLENQTGLETNTEGYAVVPYATDYRENRVALDVKSLPPRVEIDDPVTSVVPTRGAVVRAEFKARVGVKALLRLLHDGKPVPFGATVVSGDTGSSGIVADDGLVYVTGLRPEGVLRVTWGEGGSDKCEARYSLGDGSPAAPFVKGSADCQ